MQRFDPPHFVLVVLKDICFYHVGVKKIDLALAWTWVDVNCSQNSTCCSTSSNFAFDTSSSVS